VLVPWSERPGGNTQDERPFLLACGASYDLVLTNDHDGAQGSESLVSLLRERMEERPVTDPQ
jgi:hypothetical protein